WVIPRRSLDSALVMAYSSLLLRRNLCIPMLFVCLNLPALDQVPPEQVLLKDYGPHSIFKIPETRVEKARYPVIDMHSHNYAATDADIEQWVKTMDEVGLEKTVILSGNVGPKFDQVLARYGKFPGRFEVWCGVDYAGFNQPGYGPAAIAELERCRAAGAK